MHNTLYQCNTGSGEKMDNLLSGLGKFGLDEGAANNLFEDADAKQKTNGTSVKEAAVPKEEDFLLLKGVSCPICDNTFRTIQIKSGRAKRKEPDLDLRPRFEYIDANKYDVTTCPKCGFTAMNRFFGPMASVQRKMVKEGFCDKFKTPPTQEIKEIKTYTYDEAIELFKLALYATIVKKGNNSEKAYECLKIAWLIRGKMEGLVADKEKNREALLTCQKEYATFYTQAFEGFVKAMTTENYPMCGMDQSTVDLLIASMAYNLGKYDYSSRFVSSLLVSHTARANIKNRAHDLKDKLMEKMNQKK